MTNSDKIYILENFYKSLDINIDQIISDSNKILSETNKITRVRYIDTNQKDCWHNVDKHTDTRFLESLSTPLTIYTQADIRHEQTVFEHRFLKRFMNEADVHCHFENQEFISNFYTFKIVTKYLMEIFDIQKENDLCWVLFKWTNPKMCDWHIDGQKTYQVSNITNPTKVTINLSLTDNSYIELKKTDGNIISNKFYPNDLFMFNHNQRYHRIILQDKIRLGLAFRLRNVDFTDIVVKLRDLNMIKNIVD